MNSERQTLQEKIDLQLGRAGWDVGSRPRSTIQAAEAGVSLNRLASAKLSR